MSQYRHPGESHACLSGGSRRHPDASRGPVYLDSGFRRNDAITPTKVGVQNIWIPAYAGKTTWMVFILSTIFFFGQFAFAQQAVDSSTPTANAAKQKDIQQRYEKAFLYYKGGDYGPALQIWSDILKIDPDQKTAKTMIEEARAKVEEKTKERRNMIGADITSGKYQKALVDLQLLLDEDPTNPRYLALQKRLEGIARILPQASLASKESKITVLALGGYLGEKEDLRLAYNGLRYARDLNPSDPKVGRLLELFETEHPDMAGSDPVTPGMKFLEFKRFVSLNQIYDGKYHLAVNTLNDILMLEPKDLVSLKRLGSAYYALGHAQEAKRVWRSALKLAPNDKQLKRFLTHPPKIRARKASSANSDSQ